MTLLEWLLPTLVILGGLIDAMCVFILSKEKPPKEQVDEKKPEEKTSKMQKFLQLFEVPASTASTESEPKLWSFCLS